MHDIRTIRDNPAAFDAALARRGIAGLASHILALDEVRRDSIQGSEDLLAQRNAVSKAVGDMIRSGADSDLIALRKQEVVDLKSEIERLGNEAKESETRLQNLLLTIPNLPYDDVPTGTDDHGNVEIRRHGAPRNFAFTPVEHYDIKAVAAQMDFESAAKLSGARFVVLTGATARVHRALAQFMLDTHVDDHGLQETITPVLVRPEMMYGTGQLPKFGEDSYETTNGWWLIPTAEVTLTNMVNGDTVEENTLPRRYVAHTNCFRSEAGSAGRDTAGMLRQHQFEKVEMVSITTPDQSEAEHKRMTECAQNILEKLGLAYRTMILCTGDMGAGARRTHDLEVWLPGQNTYREISSVSTCGDYQARRMNARFKPRAGGKPEFVHTLNGSGLAVGRTLIAVLENGQNEDGSVTLPAVLHHYLGGKTTISAEGQLT